MDKRIFLDFLHTCFMEQVGRIAFSIEGEIGVIRDSFVVEDMQQSTHSIDLQCGNRVYSVDLENVKSIDFDEDENEWHLGYEKNDLYLSVV